MTAAAAIGVVALLLASPAETSRLGLVSFKRVAVPDDVPAHLCTGLAEDRDGFLWIGTQGGLVRYDGFEFRTFRAAPDDPQALPGSYVRALLPARDGRLWVGTFADGLARYDPGTEAFTRFRHDEADAASLSHDRVEALAEAADGSIWAATYAGLDRVDARGRVERVALPEDAAGGAAGGDRLRALLVDHAGRLWVGGRGGLFRLREDGGPRHFERVALGGDARPFVSRLYEDVRGRLWVGTADRGAAVLDPGGGVHRLLPPAAAAARPDELSHFYVYGIAPGPPGEVWLATFGGGVDVVDTDTLRVVDRLRHDPTDESTIGGDRVGGLLRDRAGLLWVGTWGQGLARHDPSTRAFRALRSSAARSDRLSHPAVVRALEMQDPHGGNSGTVWAGTDGNGVDVIDWARGRVGGFRPDARAAGALAHGSVTCLAQAADGTAWVATLDGTLHRLRPGARGFERLTRASGLPGGPIRSMVFGPDGALWAGSNEGLARVDPHTGAVTAYRHDPGDAASLSSHEVEALAFGADGTLWVGTDSGLNAFDTRSGRAARFTRKDGLPSNWVPDLMCASDGRLWVATQGGAAVMTGWNGRQARFVGVAAQLGRPPQPADALIEDAQGFVWIGPRLRVDPRTWTAREFLPADGLAFRSFFIASRSRTRSGALLFGSPEGLMVVEPGRLQEWDYAPPVLATALRVEGRPRPPRAEALVLAPSERGFQMSFASLDLSAPQRTAYRYRLEGFDRNWAATDAARRSLSYTNLPPGRYRLRVQATNRAGRFSAHEIDLPLTVQPTFVQTRTFTVLLVLLAAGLAYGVHRLRTARLHARSRALEQVVRERTQELREAYARIEETSLTDPLTGLRNRRFLERALPPDVELAIRRHEDGGAAAEEAFLVFLLLDLDHFKRVNDEHGHATGDAVLRHTAELLRSQLRSSDYAVRWGGEEFLVVARFVRRAEAPAIAEKLRAAVAASALALDGSPALALTCSLGYAAFPPSTRTPRATGWERVVALADEALYAAKRAGRNRALGADAS